MFSSLTNDENIDIYLVRAIGHFVLNRDTVSAMKCINRCKSLSIANTSWKYSAAFLEAYRKNIDSAMQYYDAAFPGESKHETPFQIENFIAWVLELEPDKQQLHFCLGYINEQYKNDMISALEHYRVFIDSTPCEETSILAVKHAKNFINNSTI